MKQSSNRPKLHMYAVAFVGKGVTAPGATTTVSCFAATKPLRLQRLFVRPTWSIDSARIVKDDGSSRDAWCVAGYVHNSNGVIRDTRSWPRWKWLGMREYGLGYSLRQGERLELTAHNTTRRRLLFRAGALVVVCEGHA